MKRNREAELTSSSEIRSAIEELSLMEVNLKTDGGVASASGGDQPPPTVHQVPIKPFLSLCSLLVQVLDKIGPTMAVLRQDIHRNIERLEKFHDSDPSLYRDVVEILKKESKEDKAKKGSTCSKAFVWLTRSLDFTSCLLELLAKDFERNMEQAVEEAYHSTLKPWHGWIASAAYKVALKLVPDSTSLANVLKSTKDEDLETLKKQVERMIELLGPVLNQNHYILKTYGLDKLKST